MALMMYILDTTSIGYPADPPWIKDEIVKSTNNNNLFYPKELLNSTNLWHIPSRVRRP